MKKNRRNNGLISIEIVVAISVLAAIIGVLLALSRSFGKLNEYLWAKQTCSNAGQAQMDAIDATGKPIDATTFEQLWPGVTCKINTSNGTGQWEGLQQIDLTLSKKVKKHKDVRIRLIRYLPASKGAEQ